MLFKRFFCDTNDSLFCLELICKILWKKKLYPVFFAIIGCTTTKNQRWENYRIVKVIERAGSDEKTVDSCRLAVQQNPDLFDEIIQVKRFCNEGSILIQDAMMGDDLFVISRCEFQRGNFI